jgi:hypothetical protein
MIVSLKAGDWIQVELPSGARINIEVTADYSMTTRQDGKVLYHEIKENETVDGRGPERDASADSLGEATYSVISGRDIEGVITVVDQRIKEGWLPAGGITTIPTPGYPGIQCYAQSPLASLMCLCRQCNSEYDPYKSRADYQGYCSQGCMKRKLKWLGWTKGTSMYKTLRDADAIGFVACRL